MQFLDTRSRRLGAFRSGREHLAGPFQQLAFPLGNLIHVDIKLLTELHQGLFPLQRHLGLVGR